MDQTAPLETDVPCVSCGYNLRGLLPNGRCPECNAAIERSLCGDELRFADPQWLARVGRGSWLISMAWNVALVGFVGLLAGLFPLGLLWGTGAFGTVAIVVCIVFLLMIIGAPALLIVGVWFATTEEPAAEQTGQPLILRSWLRVWSIVAAVAVITVPTVIGGSGFGSPIADIAVVYLAGIALAGAVGMGARYGAWLAYRIPDANTANRLRTTGRQFIGAVLTSVVLYTAGHYGARLSLPAIAGHALLLLAILQAIYVLTLSNRLAGCLNLVRAGIRSSLETARQKLADNETTA